MIEVQLLVCLIEGNLGKSLFSQIYYYASIWGCSSRSDGVPLLKLTPSFDPYGWIRVLVHGLEFDRGFKGWMGEAWKRELAGWFLRPSGRVLGQFFFFQTASLDARIAMVGSDHPFDGRMGRLEIGRAHV